MKGSVNLIRWMRRIIDENTALREENWRLKMINEELTKVVSISEPVKEMEHDHA